LNEQQLVTTAAWEHRQSFPGGDGSTSDSGDVTIVWPSIFKLHDCQRKRMGSVFDFA
jgi:hypothetical protein